MTEQKACERAARKNKTAAEQNEAAQDAAESAQPEGKAQRNFTDPEARIMKTGHGFDYAYNGQAFVDDTTQVVIATDMTQQATDVRQLVPIQETMTEQLSAAGIDHDPAVSLADAGYCSNANLIAAGQFPSTVLIATGRELKGESFAGADESLPDDASVREAMAHRLRQPDGRADYARRKAIVEPVFGQMKTRQRAGQLRLRGLAAAKCEWVLHAVCHNLRKMGTNTLFEAGAWVMARPEGLESRCESLVRAHARCGGHQARRQCLFAKNSWLNTIGGCEVSYRVRPKNCARGSNRLPTHTPR